MWVPQLRHKHSTTRSTDPTVKSDHVPLESVVLASAFTFARSEQCISQGQVVVEEGVGRKIALVATTMHRPLCINALADEMIDSTTFWKRCMAC